MEMYAKGQKKRLPSIGATPQRQYMRDLSIEEMEKIGNGGKQGYYA
jgi:hypothetical protein